MATVAQHMRAEMLLSLLPPGPIWEDLFPLLLGCSGEPSRFAEMIDALPDNYLPDTCSEEYAALWERALDLDASSLTIEQRRSQIVSHLRGFGDPNLPNLQSAADAWGKNAVIEEHQFPLFEMGVGAMGDPLRGDAWAFALKITYDAPASPEFEAAMLRLLQFQNYIVFEVV